MVDYCWLTNLPETKIRFEIAVFNFKVCALSEADLVVPLEPERLLCDSALVLIGLTLELEDFFRQMQ